VTHGVNIVTIRADDKGAIVVRVILRPQAGRPVVPAAGGHGAAIEVVDLTPGLCGKGEVQRSTFHRARTEPERRFVVSSQPYAVRDLHYNSDAERGKRFDEECLARFEITGADSNVIEHDFLLLPGAWPGWQ
jgi:hypothetical protein